MILVIDNYDSFTYNLVQYLRELNLEIRVFRNDKIDLSTINLLKPERIIISPGPGSPDDAGISKDVIRVYGKAIPLLGVCLGHQCIAEVYGGVVSQAPRLMHGKTSLIYHEGAHPFESLPNPFQATRYHSLIVNHPLPDSLLLTAATDQSEIMGLRHTKYPIFGVQFHPESILTPQGKQLIHNFAAG